MHSFRYLGLWASTEWVSGHIVKGVLHWTVAIPNYSQHSFKDHIIYFDAATDEFGTVNIPSLKYRAHRDGSHIFGMGELNGCLAMTWGGMLLITMGVSLING